MLLVGVYNVLARVRVVVDAVDDNNNDTKLGKYLTPLLPKVSAALDSVLDAMWKVAGWLRVQDQLETISTLSELSEEHLFESLDAKTAVLESHIRDTV